MDIHKFKKEIKLQKQTYYILIQLSPPPLFGNSVSISADGSTALIGAPNDNFNIGAALAYSRIDGQWIQIGDKLLGWDAIYAYQGSAVAISADGNTAVVGGTGDNSGQGAVFVYTQIDGQWIQQGNKLVGSNSISATNTSYALISQGYSVAISADGNTIIEGAPYDNNIGAAWVFKRDFNGNWSQQGHKLIGTGEQYVNNNKIYEGSSVAISADGNTAIVGGPGDNNRIGAAWVYIRVNGNWIQQGTKLIGGGSSVALSADGNTAMLGSDSGAIVYTRSNGRWYLQNDINLYNYGYSGLFPIAQVISDQSPVNSSISMSSDGNTAIIGTPNDSSGRGSVWVFTRTDNIWSYKTNLVGSGYKGQYPAKVWDVNTASFKYINQNLIWEGNSVSLSADGSTAIFAGPGDSANYYGGFGAAWVFGPFKNLPVKISSFYATAMDTSIETRWQTATELNTSHFIIQHATDGANFSNIGTIKAIGTGANSYSFTDTHPATGINYYRLQSVDKDGSSNYSKVVSINIGDKHFFSIVPNPAKDFATINFSKAVDNAKITVYDMTGKAVISKSLSGSIKDYKINTKSLNSGFYVIKVNTDIGNYNDKLLINK